MAKIETTVTLNIIPVLQQEEKEFCDPTIFIDSDGNLGFAIPDIDVNTDALATATHQLSFKCLPDVDEVTNNPIDYSTYLGCAPLYCIKVVNRRTIEGNPVSLTADHTQLKDIIVNGVGMGVNKPVVPVQKGKK